MSVRSIHIKQPADASYDLFGIDAANAAAMAIIETAKKP